MRRDDTLHRFLSGDEFQLTRLREARPRRRCNKPQLSQFQLTRLREARHFVLFHEAIQKSFN